MRLYENNFNEEPSEENKKVWRELKEQEIIPNTGNLPIRKSQNDKYPKSIRHFSSLFPNNFLDTIDLKYSKSILTTILNEFELLIENNKITERHILDFVKDKKAYFIIGSILKNGYLFGHHASYVFPEFMIGINYQADYLIVGSNSDGYHFVFVELENPYGAITNRDGEFGTTIRKGINQVKNWDFWLEQNFSILKLTFEKELNIVKELPKEFRDFDKTRIHFVVVGGRRKDFKDKTYRLKRELLEDRKQLILHYDNLLDSSKEVILQGNF